jgi:hypothetical protein
VVDSNYIYSTNASYYRTTNNMSWPAFGVLVGAGNWAVLGTTAQLVPSHSVMV